MAKDPLHTRLCDDLGIEVPIIGFHHCKDVVVEICNAGGIGFLGALGLTVDELVEEINWVRERIGNKPFGVDLAFPASMPDSSVTYGDIRAGFPEEHRQFMKAIKEELKIPDPKPTPGLRPSVAQKVRNDSDPMVITLDANRKRAEVVIEMKVPLFAAGLGSPGWVIERLHANGVKVFSLVGNVRQAKRVAEGGVDYVVAQGHDSAGHTGEIGTFSLIPQVVDAVSPTPVVAAGGVCSGRQLVAALALGAIGVWTGTIWLPTRESDYPMPHKQALLDATDRDTVRTRVYSGKPGRFLRNAFTNAWERPNAPKPLQMPWQVVLVDEVVDAAFDYERTDLMRMEGNQSLGLIKEMKTTRQTVFDLIDEAQATIDRIGMASD